MGLEIGMSMNAVKAYIGKSKLEQNTKKMIIDFCSKDLDGKITDNIELYILNNYISGKKDINMSKLKDKCAATGENVQTLLGKAYKYMTGKPVTLTNGNNDLCTAQTEIKSFGGLSQKSKNNTLIQDTNKDGKADLYMSTYWNTNGINKKITINLNQNN